MRDITISFSSSELGALRVAASNERNCLLDDLENNRVPKSEVNDAHKSVELYNSLIDKIDTALPSSTYVASVHKS